MKLSARQRRITHRISSTTELIVRREAQASAPEDQGCSCKDWIKDPLHEEKIQFCGRNNKKCFKGHRQYLEEHCVAHQLLLKSSVEALNHDGRRARRLTNQGINQ